MINNPKLTLDTISRNKKALKKDIYKQKEISLNDTGIKITSKAKREIESKISLFVYDVYSNPCRYLHYLNVKDQQGSPEDN